MKIRYVLCLSAFLGAFTPAAQGDWPGFRGPDATGVAIDSEPPTEFGSDPMKNIAWKVPMPGKGVSGPIVVDGQVITTSSGGVDQRRIFITSVRAKDGTKLWEQQLVARGRPFCHPSSANAAPTPASDGKRIFAFYSSNDLACIDLQGNLVWYRAMAVDFPKAGNDVGMSSSPVVVDGVVAVQIECQGESFVAGLESESGKLLWKMDRPKQANWASPTVAKTAEGRSVLIVQSAKSLDAVAPRSGSVLWGLPLACSTIPSTAAIGNKLFVPSKGLTVLEMGSSDQSPQKAWENNKLAPNSASPVVSGKSVYCVNRSILVRGNAASGELEWQLRLPDAGSIWASPVLTKKHMYQFTEDGRCFVIDVEAPEGKVLAVNSLGEKVLGSPAISQNAIYVRSTESLWKIADR